MKIKLYSLTLVISILAVLFPSCSGSGAPTLPIKVQLSFSEPPILGKPVLLTASFNLIIEYQDAPGITESIILPEGFERISGDTERKENFIRGRTYTLQIAVKTVKTGNWMVAARASSDKSDGIGGYIELWIEVSEKSAVVRNHAPVPNNIGRAEDASPPAGYNPSAPLATPVPMDKLPTVKPIEPSQIPAPSLEGKDEIDSD